MLRRLIRVLRANLIHTLVQFHVRLSGNSVSGHNSDCHLRDSEVPRTRSADIAFMDGSAFPTATKTRDAAVERGVPT